jgi:hypothetical protein
MSKNEHRTMFAEIVIKLRENTVQYKKVICTGNNQRNQRGYFRWHTGRWQGVGCPENQIIQFFTA